MYSQTIHWDQDEVRTHTQNHLWQTHGLVRSGRITPDNNIDVGQVGIPINMCQILTYPETVTKWNIHKLTEAVRNGPQCYPGANYLADGERKLTLGVMGEHERRKLVLEHGQVVSRHLVMGDWVLFNRQPSLHKNSVMGHTVRPVPGNTFRLNLACTTPYNADFDGDEMNASVNRDE